MTSEEKRISEKESIMLTAGQNRKTTPDSDILKNQQDGVVTPSGDPPHNTDATTGADQTHNQSGGGSSMKGEAR
jgi:hypothetical protein